MGRKWVQLARRFGFDSCSRVAQGSAGELAGAWQPWGRTPWYDCNERLLAAGIKNESHWDGEYELSASNVQRSERQDFMSGCLGREGVVLVAAFSERGTGTGRACQAVG